MCQAEAPRGKEYRRPARSNLAGSSSHLLSTRVEARACAMDLAAEQKRRREVAALAVPALVEERRQQTVFAASQRCPAFVPKIPCSKDWTARALTHERRRGGCRYFLDNACASQPGRCDHAFCRSSYLHNCTTRRRLERLQVVLESCSSRAVSCVSIWKRKRQKRTAATSSWLDLRVKLDWACGV